MPGRFVGHRGARDSEWSWERTEEVSRGRKRRRWLPAALLSAAFVAGIGAFAFGIFIVVTNDNGDAAPPVVSASPSAEPTVTPAATPTEPPTTATRAPTPTATPVPSPTPGLTYTVEFASWSNTESAWIAPAHDETTSDYAEGDMVPFLLRIEDVATGTTHRVQITYDCVSSGNPAFDFIGGSGPAIEEAILTSPGPGRSLPDSTLAAPDDTSIPYDEGQRGSFRAWGAVFTSAGAPAPAAECTSAKSVLLSLRAQSSTVFLVWTGHLASADWGAGNGAAGATPFSIEIDVNGEVQRIATMAAGSVSQ